MLPNVFLLFLTFGEYFKLIFLFEEELGPFLRLLLLKLKFELLNIGSAIHVLLHFLEVLMLHDNTVGEASLQSLLIPAQFLGDFLIVAKN